MSLPRIFSAAVTFALVLAAASRSEAADQQAIIDQIESKDQAAIAAYEAGNFGKMKSLLLKAVSLVEDNDLGSNAVAARTYVLSGILQIEGMDSMEAGTRLFAKALKIAPDVQIPKGMATTPVKQAFKQAKGEPAEGAPAKTETAKSEPPPKADDSALDAERELAKEKEKDKQRDRQSREDKDREKREAAQARDAENRDRLERERAQKEKFENDKALADAKGRLEMAQEAKAGSEKALADTKARVAQLEKERSQLDKDKQALLKDKADKEKALADAKGRLQMAEQDKQAKDKQIAEGKQREDKERLAKEKLEKEKLERDKLLADTKARVAQLEKEKQQVEAAKQVVEKDKADKEKLLAESRDREKKEKEAHEKSEKARQWAEASLKERESREEQVRAERERLADGPDLPSHFSEAITCTLPDEVPAGNDLFVHCVPKPGSNAKTVAFYYRPSGVAQYNALVMERSKKGWFTAFIPATRVSGKLLQYYVEARDGRDAVVASNGKSNSPNTLMVRAGGGGAHPPTSARRGPSPR